MEYEFTMLKFERMDNKNYRLMGLPEGGNFKDESAYTELEASWLKVNGVGFSANAGEFSEHNHTITVRQERDGGSVHIEL